MIQLVKDINIDKTKFKQSSHHNLVKSYINYDMKNYFVQIPKYKMK